jgi:hypothetical protein
MLARIRMKKLTAIILTIILLSIFLFLPVILSLSDNLSKTEKVKANLLIVEGWLPPYAIEMAYKEFLKDDYDLVITTGIKMSGYYLIYSGGYLIFHTSDKLKGITMNGDHIVEIAAYSELGGKNCAHFNIFVNDSLVTDFLADNRRRKYEIKWEGRLTDIDSVMVQFDNDMVGEFGDRNLYVKEIIFDHKIHVGYQNNSEYDIGKLDGKFKINNNFTSFSELARNELLSLGLDSSLVISVPGNRVRINRTLTSALAFRDWMSKSNLTIDGINVITLGAHAKRTWMTYNKILNGKYKIGIISLPDYKTTNSMRNKIVKTLRETLGIIYYWIILLPY